MQLIEQTVSNLAIFIYTAVFVRSATLITNTTIVKDEVRMFTYR